MAKNAEKIFNRMIEDMCNIAPEDDILDVCMSLNAEAMRNIPLRYRIIALGFVNHMSLDALNEKLRQNGCPQLYSRSFWEATMIFAFMNGYSYPEWRAIRLQCADIYDSMEASAWFRECKITYAELERYVRDNSALQGDMMATEMRTRFLENALWYVGGVEDLRAFLTANLRSFSAVREKTRYYFCKYLYYWLNRRIDNYFVACARGRGVDEALSELLCLKVVTALRRNLTMPEDKKRTLIHESAISCGEIFDAFNYFYFGYVSVDWVEVLLECYENVESIPASHKSSLASIFRKGRPEWKDRTDDEVIALKMAEAEALENAAYARDGARGYGKKRDGENALYKYIQGSRDIDRTMLVCFLLFFASDGEMPPEHRLSVGRLQDILAQCGYETLDVENDFDWFVMEFLESRHPMDLLMDVVLGYAKQHENSFLYHVYGRAVLHEDELARVMLGKG